MYYDQIINLSLEQIDNLNNFLLILKDLQNAIVQNDLEKIELTIEQEEKALNRIKLCEDNRIGALKVALDHYEIKTDKAEALDKLADIILATDPDVYQEFNNVRTELLEKVKEVLLINQQNEIIVNNSRKFIRDLIKSVLGTKKESFLDRKI